MWLFTDRGFYSAVQKFGDRRDGMVTVRARVKGDLTRLQEVLPTEAKPYKKKYSDYPWRVRVSQEDWAFAVARMAMDIDYSNFKDRVMQRLGPKREGVYHRVWAVLLDLEVTRPRKKGKGRRSRGYGNSYREPVFSQTSLPVMDEHDLFGDHVRSKDEQEALDDWFRRHDMDSHERSGL